MPLMDEQLDSNNGNNLLLYGKPLSKKTWWALKAAELGYNIIYLDFDGNYQVAKNLTPEARSRIMHVDMRFRPDGDVKRCPFAALALAIGGATALYDPIKREYLPVKEARTRTDDTFVRFDFNASTGADIILVDSWTAACEQMSTYVTPLRDQLQLPEYGREQSDYSKMRSLGERVLLGLPSFNAHCIWIGHEIEYAKRKADAAANERPENAIESISTSIASVSKAHGATIAKSMSDVLHFYFENSQVGFMISTKPRADRIGGSRTQEPKQKKWEDFPASDFFKPLDNLSAGYNSKAVTEITGVELGEKPESKPLIPNKNVTKILGRT